MSKRRSSRRKAVDIDLSGIKYDSTCVDITPGGLPLSLACDICKSKLDIFTKKSSQKNKKERQKHLTNRCKQYRMSKWLDDSSNRTPGEFIKHNITRNYLGIEQGIEIDYGSYKKLKTTSMDYQREKTTRQIPNPVNLLRRSSDTELQEILESNISNVFGQGPTDPPSELENETPTLPIQTDNVNEIQTDNINTIHAESHTPDVTGDVVNDSHGHTDLIVIEDLDVTVDVVNEPHGHTIAVQTEPEKEVLDERLYTRISKRHLAHLRRDAAIGAAVQKK